MSATRENLVQAILAEPDDDTPRLVLADWFEEQGDPAGVARAEFIRTQIERARLDPRDPQQSEMQAREYRLLAAHAKDWCGSHFVFKKARFRRGFIEYVHLHLTHFLHHRRQMFALEPVRDISLTGWMRADDHLVRQVAACAELRHVETLRIHHQGPHKAPRSNLVLLLESPHLTGLKSLRVPTVDFTADARRRFERAAVMQQLEELTLPGFDRYPDNPGEWFADGAPAWANLKSLRVGEMYGHMDVFTRLVAMPFWKDLRALRFPVAFRQTAPQFDLIGRNLPPGLQSLTVETTASPITVPDVFFEQVARVPLWQLHLDGVPLSSASVARLFGPDSALQLEDFSYDGQGLTATDFDILAESGAIRALRSLAFSYFGRSGQPSFVRLLGSDAFRGLTSLSLVYPPANSDIVRALAVGGRPHLRRLSLYCAKVPPDDWQALLTSPACQALVQLRIEQDHREPQPLPAEIAALLCGLPHLASLSLRGFPRLPAVRAALKASESLAWAGVEWNDDWSSEDFEPNNLPPLDEDLTDLERWA